MAIGTAAPKREAAFAAGIPNGSVRLVNRIRTGGTVVGTGIYATAVKQNKGRARKDAIKDLEDALKDVRDKTGALSLEWRPAARQWPDILRDLLSQIYSPGDLAEVTK